MNKRILVTSCGGDIGQSIGKILNELNYETFGLDMSSKNAARFIFNHFDTGLRVNNKNYLSSIADYVNKYNIDAIIPVSEVELRFYTRIERQEIPFNPSKLIMANRFARQIGLDKSKTNNFLKDNKLPYPQIYTSSDSNIIFPLVAKPKTGSGSKNIFIVNDNEEMLFLSKKYTDLLFQEMLDGQQGEFTCCLFKTPTTDLRTIIFKRELYSGFSGYGEVFENKIINTLLSALADLLKLNGSINVQLRLHKGQAVVFEINPRFSSTVRFRHMLGFKDLQWSLENLFLNQISDYVKPEVGRKFYKGFDEYIV